MSRATHFQSSWADGKLSEALAVARDALESGDHDERRDVAGELGAATLAALNSTDPHVAEALALLVAFAETDEQSWRALAMLARYHQRHRQIDAALRVSERILDIVKRRRSLRPRTLTSIGDLRLDAGDVSGAEQSYRQAIATLERARRRDPEALASALVPLVTLLER